MPRRNIPLVRDEYYHVFNRGTEHRPVFNDRRDYKRAMNTIEYYNSYPLNIKLSRYLILSAKKRLAFSNKNILRKRLVDVVCYCLMPNHFHLLLRQEEENGISNLMRLIQNSYTRYYNTKHNRDGALFKGSFKAVRIENDNHLIQISRYIHLNPYTSYLVKDLPALTEYPWSSLNEYTKNSPGICKKEVVMSLFKNTENYESFIYDKADYQRKLKNIKHLTLE
jgi:putative transposase